MKTFASVAAYLRAVPPAPHAALQQLRHTIKAAALVKARVAQNEAQR